jgi:phosphatidylinositol glycan class B
MYLLSFTYLLQVQRLFSSSYEAVLAIVSISYLLKIKKGKESNAENIGKVVALQTLSFIIRNTSPIGWVPVLLLKAYECGFVEITCKYLKGFVLIFLPLTGLATYLDCVYYGTFTVVPWNFIKVNVFEGLSQEFGSDPMLLYVTHELPKRLHVFFPCFILSIPHYIRWCHNLHTYPYLAIYTGSMLLFLSLISHKEPKFLLPAFPFFFLFVAKYLQDTWMKTNYRLVKCGVYLFLAIEVITSLYFVHLHDLGAFAPVKYLQQTYPAYTSLITNNKFEGNYLTLTHPGPWPAKHPQLFFVNHDPPFVQK